MAKVTITLNDTPEGLVSVDTVVEGYDEANPSPATQMASTVNQYIAAIATKRDDVSRLVLVGG